MENNLTPPKSFYSSVTLTGPTKLSNIPNNITNPLGEALNKTKQTFPFLRNINYRNHQEKYLYRPNQRRSPLGDRNYRRNRSHGGRYHNGLQNSVKILGKPLRLLGNNGFRWRQKSSNSFHGLGKLKLRLN